MEKKQWNNNFSGSVAAGGIITVIKSDRLGADSKAFCE